MSCTTTAAPISPINLLRSRVMKVAWGLHRPAPSAFAGLFTPPSALSFGECLRSAWAFIRRMDAFNRAHPLRAGRDGVIRLASPVHSPASNRLAGQPWARAHDRQAGRSIARMGW